MVCATRGILGRRGLERSVLAVCLIGGWGCHLGHADIDQTSGGAGGIAPQSSGGQSSGGRAASGGAMPDECAGKSRFPFYLDADGDGWGVGGEVGVVCEGSPAPPGYTLRASLFFSDRDCDDADPTRQVLRYADEDHDGYGVEPLVCVDNTSADYANVGGDCPEFDPARHPGVLESALDDVDSDCDGFDAPMTTDCTDIQPLDPAKIVLAPTCVGMPDLFIAAFRACMDGPAVWRVIVGNRGDVGAYAEFVVNMNGSEIGPRTYDLGWIEPGSLAPQIQGEYSRPALQVVVHVQAKDGAADCAPQNDRGTVEVTGYVNAL